jgi:hypothetical protein
VLLKLKLLSWFSPWIRSWGVGWGGWRREDERCFMFFWCMKVNNASQNMLALPIGKMMLYMYL